MSVKILIVYSTYKLGMFTRDTDGPTINPWTKSQTDGLTEASPNARHNFIAGGGHKSTISKHAAELQ